MDVGTDGDMSRRIDGSTQMGVWFGGWVNGWVDG